MTDGSDRREYKTVALPKTTSRWSSGKTVADRTAQAMGEIINREAASGWRYLGADVVRVDARVGLTGARMERSHTILVFERPARAGAMREAPRSRGFEDDFEEEPRAAPRRAAARRSPERSEPPAPAATPAAGRGRGYGLDEDPGFGADDPYAAERRPTRRRPERGGELGEDASDARPRGLVESMVSSRRRID